MTTLLQHTYTDEELYPSFDGNPMAENTLQYEWIVLIKENLERLFTDREDVFIAGDLLWYPIRVAIPPAPRQAPDVMVVFGRPKGDRKSYRQQEEDNIAPQVAFEILSDSNKTTEGREAMAKKRAFYEKYGIEEYYIYDPDTYDLEIWVGQGGKFTSIGNVENWVSPRLGVRFRSVAKEKLKLFFPDSSPFLSTIELSKSLQQAQQAAEVERQQRQQAQQAAEQAQQVAEVERQQRQQAQQAAEQAQQVAEQAQQAAEIERQQRQQAQQVAEQAQQAAEIERQQRQQAQQVAEQAQQAAEIERLSNQKLREKLRSLGIDPDGDI